MADVARTTHPDHLLRAIPDGAKWTTKFTISVTCLSGCMIEQ